MTADEFLAAFAAEVGGVPPTGEQVAAIAGAVREAVNNARKHANARQVVIGVDSADDGCTAVTVTDDGIGIDQAAPPGFGIRGMRERVQAFGGDTTVARNGAKGTCVRITIPVGDRA